MSKRQPNIILLVLDTHRAERMSLYGYGKHTTPNIDRLAEKATIFDERVRNVTAETVVTRTFKFGLRAGSFSDGYQGIVLYVPDPVFQPIGGDQQPAVR